jgi:transcriptional regulator with XRE-family HTH domain
MPKVNGKALIEARRKRQWTQAELSEATKPQINISTISRIERGKAARVREGTLKELGRALGVPRENLCTTSETERDVVKLRVEAAARNALTLVARRYRISRESIVEAAPLLFFIAAEKSLQERRKHIAEIRNAGDALWDMQRRTRHLPLRWPMDEGTIDSEERSIKARDLFGTKVIEDAEQLLSQLDDEYEDAEHNPFVAFLRNALAEACGSRADPETVTWTPGLWPRYEICADEAADIVGGDEKAAQAILCGAAALHEMPKASAAEMAEWARAEFDRKYGDLESLFSEALPLNESDNNSPASGSGRTS